MRAYYVGFKVGDQDIGLGPNGHAKGMTGPVGYRNVNDMKKSLQLLLDAGAQMHHVNDVGGGKLIASVKDADGNVIGLIQLPKSSHASLFECLKTRSVNEVSTVTR